MNTLYSVGNVGREQADAWLVQIKQQVAFPGKRGTVRVFGRKCTEPRDVVGFPAAPGLCHAYSGKQVECAYMPAVVREMLDYMNARTGASYNFALVNRYRDHTDSIGFHHDDERNLDTTHPVVSLSFGAARTFVLKPAAASAKGRRALMRIPKPLAQTHKILLEHGSAFMMAQDTNRAFKHGVPKSRRKCGERVSVTFFRVESKCLDG